MQALFNHVELNSNMWLLVRTYCQDLLGSEELKRYRELYDESNDSKNHQSDWGDLLERFYPDDEFVSTYEGQYDINDDSKKKAELMCKRLIAYHQLEAFSLYLKDKPAQSAAYREILVSIFSMVFACIFISIIKISHYHSAGALQS